MSFKAVEELPQYCAVYKSFDRFLRVLNLDIFLDVGGYGNLGYQVSKKIVNRHRAEPSKIGHRLLKGIKN